MTASKKTHLILRTSLSIEKATTALQTLPLLLVCGLEERNKVLQTTFIRHMANKTAENTQISTLSIYFCHAFRCGVCIMSVQLSPA